MSAKINVLKPQLVWLGNKCYRKLPVRSDGRSNPEEEESYPVTPRLASNCGDEDKSSMFINSENDTFWVTIFVPSCLIHLLYNKMKEIYKIEAETQTSIKRQNRKQGDLPIELTVHGNDRPSVLSAYQRIQIILDSGRSKNVFTHFISIPMNSSNLKESLLNFKKDVLMNCKGTRGLDESIFQNPHKLHLTIIPLVLLDRHEKETAAHCLQNCKDEIVNVLRDKPLTVSVKGIEYMNDDPTEVDVLYAKVSCIDESGSLQFIADTIADALNKMHYAAAQVIPVKLHLTIMNTIFRSDDTDEEVCSRRKKEERETFDAKKILQRYKDYDFGITTVSEIHISIRYTKNKNGYYMSYAVLSLE